MIILPDDGGRGRAYLLREAQRLRRLADDLGRVAKSGAPNADELANAPRLESWRIHPLVTHSLIGFGTGHPRLPDGPIFTTEVWAMDASAGWARTLSRFYRLGAPETSNTGPGYE